MPPNNLPAALKIAVNSRMLLEKGTGVPNYIAYLYRACLKMDAANRYVFFQPNTSRTIGETRTASAPSGLLGAAVFDSLRAQKLLRENPADIFHGPSHILPLVKRAGVKYVVTIHDLAFRVFPAQYDWKHRCYYGWQVKRSLKMADVVVADSHNTKKDIIRFYGVPEERIEVVHLGTGEEFFKADDAARERLIADKYFFSITTHPSRKNITGALRAFAKIASQYEVKYVIAGLMGEKQRQELFTLADELGVRDKMTLFGYASDEQLINLYRNAEFFIYPSFYEGFGLPPVEAMACGCPVIASNTSSLPEIMPDGEWLVDPHDLSSIAAKMQRMLALSPEDRRQIGIKNKQHARKFTWDMTAARMIDIFQNLGRQR